MSREATSGDDPVVAILVWGDVIEDYLDPLGLSVDDFCDGQVGGWLFGFAEALQHARVNPVIVCWSTSVVRPTARSHTPTRTVMWVLPTSRLYRATRCRVTDPYVSSRPSVTANRYMSDLRATVARNLVPYLTSTPVRLARLLRREGCRAVLCQEYEEGRFDICVGLGRALRLPVVATFQGGNHTRTRLERLVRPHSVRAAAGFVIGADSEADRVRDHYRVPPDRIARIPNPFDPVTIQRIPKDVARSRLGLACGTPVAVWIGRVDITPKGIDVLIEAWRQVREHCLKAPTLLMLGTGSGAGWLRSRIAELELDDVCWRDEFVLDRAIVSTFLCAGDVFVLPSRQEGFPVAPMEAMAAGLPVVACDAPGVRGVVGEGDDAGGIVVPRDNPYALAHALQSLINDCELRTAFGEKAARRVVQQFSLDAVGVQLREVLLERNNPRPRDMGAHDMLGSGTICG